MTYLTTAPSWLNTTDTTLHSMEKFNINHLKNILIASKGQYQLMLPSKVEWQ